MKMFAAATVGDLREALKNLPDDTLVMQARDEEGNGFLPLMRVSTGLYIQKEDLMLPTSAAALSPGDTHSVVCLWPAHDWQHGQMIAEAQRAPSQKK